MIFRLSTLISFKGDSRFIYVVLYLFTDTGVQQDFHIHDVRFNYGNSNPIGVTIGAVTATLPEHMGSPFLWVRVAQLFVFC
jgi:hypothetical protein